MTGTSIISRRERFSPRFPLRIRIRHKPRRNDAGILSGTSAMSPAGQSTRHKAEYGRVLSLQAGGHVPARRGHSGHLHGHVRRHRLAFKQADGLYMHGGGEHVDEHDSAGRIPVAWKSLMSRATSSGCTKRRLFAVVSTRLSQRGRRPTIRPWAGRVRRFGRHGLGRGGKMRRRS